MRPPRVPRLYGGLRHCRRATHAHPGAPLVAHAAMGRLQVGQRETQPHSILHCSPVPALPLLEVSQVSQTNRWWCFVSSLNTRRARPLLLDFITPRGPGAAAALAAAQQADSSRQQLQQGGRGSRGGRGGRGAPPAATDAMEPGPRGGRSGSAAGSRGRSRGSPGLQDDEAFPTLGAAAGAGGSQQQGWAGGRALGLGDTQETEGGLAVIDDDLGAAADAAGAAGRTGRAGVGAGGAGGAGAAAAGLPVGPALGPGAARLAGVWAGRPAGAGAFT